MSNVIEEEKAGKAVAADDDDEEDEEINFVPFTPQSWANQLEHEAKAKLKAEERKSKQGEAHLVDGVLKFDAEEDPEEKKEPSPSLKEGNVLPDHCVFDAKCYGKPLEEIDKYIKDKTFTVIAPRFKKKYIYRFSSTRSFFILTPWNLLRRFCVYIATNQFFDYFIITTILVNCVFLAMPDEPIAETAEYIFLAIYTVEMFIKLLARGFFINSYTYLRDPWNWLDFIVIVTAYLTIILENVGGSSGLGNLQGIRTFRVFRILRTVSILPGLKTIVNALLRAFKLLLEVMMLITFCLMVFALFALQVYMGVLRQKCVFTVPNYTATPSLSYEQYYNDWIKDDNNWYTDDEGGYPMCGNVTSSRSCPANYTCLSDIGENPNFGYTSFDHFGWAMLTSFQLLTLDFWEDTYDKVLQTSGPWNVIFFVITVFFGSFYLVNLMLAVVAMSYEEEAETAGKKAPRRKTSSPPPLSISPLPKAPTDCNNSDLSVIDESSDVSLTMFRTYDDDDDSGEVKLQFKAFMTGNKYNDKYDITLNSIQSKGRPPEDNDSGFNSPEVEEKEKEMKKAKKTKKKKQEDDPWKALAAETKAKVSHAGEEALHQTHIIGHPHPHHPPPTSPKKEDTLSPAKGDSKVHIQRKPLVKMPSKDSGTGNSVESSRSNGSGIDDRESFGSSLITTSSIGKKGEVGLGNATTADGKPKKILVKQGSKSVVSTSGVEITNQGFIEDISENNANEEEGDKGMEAEPTKDEKVPFAENHIDFGEKYPNITIVEVEEDNPDVDPEKGQLINRNCPCCMGCCKGHLFVPWLKVQGVIYMFVTDPLFDLFITICIVLNTLFMALEFHGMPYELEQTLNIANYIFTSVFIMEAMLKIMALTKYYFKTGWNIFDLVIVIASIIDLGVTDIDGLSAFRTFRLLRIFKLAQSWPTMRLLLSIIVSTLGALANLTGVLAIVIYIFAVIGLQLFNKSYTAEKFDPDPVPRWNFKDIFHSFMMIFRVLCGEWIEPLWDCMRAANEVCMAVYLPTLILGNFIVLNLFLALLLNAFASDSLRKAKENTEENKLYNAWLRIKDICCCCLNKKPARVSSVGPDDEPLEPDETIHIGDDKKIPEDETKLTANGTNGTSKTAKVSPEKPQLNGVIGNKDSKKKMPIGEAFSTNRGEFSDFDKAREANGVKNAKPSLDPKVGKSDDAKKTSADSGSKKDDDGLELGDEAATLKKEEEEEEKPIVLEDCLPPFLTRKRLCFSEEFDETNFGQRWRAARIFTTKVVEHKVFEAIILILIATSSITLAFEDVTLYKYPTRQEALYVMNLLFAALFTIEMVLKLFAFGLKKYFTNFWTILDFCIVVISWASIIAEALGAADISAFRALRTLRALRPLRAISRWQGMRIVVNALMMAIPSIFNVLVVCIIFWLIFSIMGVQFFKGKFAKCMDGDTKLEPSVVANKVECLAKNYSWTNPDVNFDHVGNGYLALFQVATFEGWMEVMEDAVDSTAIDEQPSFENNLYLGYLYFVFFIIFGTFFTLNLFIGVIIDNFNMLKKKYDGSYLDMFLTSGQRQYYNTLKKLGNRKPQKTIKRPKNKVQGLCYDISVSNKFEFCIVIFIFLNMIAMAVEHYKQTDAVTEALEMLNLSFTVIFTMEAIVKIIGLRLHYFRQPWNIFDFTVVLLSWIGIVLDDILSSVFVTPTLLRVVRVFRIGRVLRLIKSAKGIRKLLFALIISMPALINIGALLCLIMYIYAIIGLSQFQNIKISGLLDEDVVNFRTFFNSFILLFRLSTAAGWNDILEPLMISEPDCDPDYYTRTDGVRVAKDNGECGNKGLAIFFMVTYIIIIFLVIINMYIAVILENFSQAHEQEEVGITEDDFEMFYVVWEKYDPLATQFIKYEQLSSFVADLDEPLGIPKPNEIALVSFDLPIVEGDKLHCLDVLMALVKYVLGNVEETPEFKELHKQMEATFEATFPTRVNTSVKSSTMMRKKEDVAAKTLQRAWRSWKTQKQLKNITALAMQQSLSRSNSQTSRSRTSSIMSLGHRLTTALSNFFSSSRPSSAISRLSAKSNSNIPMSSPKDKKKKPGSTTNTLQVPKVAVLYPSGSDTDRDIELPV